MRVFTDELKRTDRNRFGRLKAGPFGLSVQAGDGLYSTPRRTAEVDEYRAWEVAMFDEEGDWLSPVDLGVPVPGLNRHWEPLEPGGTAVAGYVPTAIVQALFTWCIMQGEGGVDEELDVMPEYALVDDEDE